MKLKRITANPGRTYKKSVRGQEVEKVREVEPWVRLREWKRV
jgi:hypothetical protein